MGGCLSIEKRKPKAKELSNIVATSLKGEFSDSKSARSVPSTGDDASSRESPTRSTLTFAGWNVDLPMVLRVGRKGSFKQGYLKAIVRCF